MTIPWTATVWDPDTGNHSIRSLYGLHPGDSSFGDSISGGSRITLNRGIDAIVRYILLPFSRSTNVIVKSILRRAM